MTNLPSEPAHHKTARRAWPFHVSVVASVLATNEAAARTFVEKCGCEVDDDGRLDLDELIEAHRPLGRKVRKLLLDRLDARRRREAKRK